MATKAQPKTLVLSLAVLAVALGFMSAAALSGYVPGGKYWIASAVMLMPAAFADRARGYRVLPALPVVTMLVLHLAIKMAGG